MDESLLQTKLFIPIVRHDPAAKTGTSFIPRPRLIQQLDAGLGGKLTLISAPAGFGKTTLVSSWLEHVKLPAAWFSLDEDDNGIVRFWTYFVAALQTILPETGKDTLALLQSSPPPRGRSLLTPLLNDLAAVSEKILVVLDDYHIIENESIDQNLTFFIDHLPPNMHLVMISRVDPNVPIARLRARRQLNELRSADLRFTPAETGEFLVQMTDIGLTAEEVATLDRRTEGWIVGLQMAALSLRQREAAAAAKFIEDFSGSHRYVMDYLVDEVLQGLPAEVQTFLLYTSILDQLCSSLCESIMPGGSQDLSPSPMVLNAEKAQEILTYLEHANLFITPLDDQRHWYRYHPLFSDLLRHRLSLTYPDQVSKLHLRASQWYEQAGLIGPAVQHALAAKAYGHAASMVEQFAPIIVQRSELSRLLSWIDSLPQDEVRARPLLALYYVWGLFLTGKIKQATAQLDALEAILATDVTRQTPEVQAHTAAMRANLLRETGDFTKAIALSRQALAYLPEQDSLLQARIKLNLSFAYYLQGEFEPAFQLLTEIIATDQTDQRILNTLSAFYIKTQLLRAQGALRQALQLCQDGLALVARRGWDNFPAAGFLYVAFGDLLRERNDLTTAMEYLDRGINLGQEGGIPHISITGYVWRARLRQIQGNVHGSQEEIQSALQLVQQHEMSRFWPIPPAACWQARLWIAQGNLVAASRWAQFSGLNEADRPITYLYEVENLTVARLMIGQGHLEAAESLLLQMHRAAASAGRDGSLIEILVLQAIAFEADKRSKEALMALGQAFDLAEPEGFVRVFLDEGCAMAELLRKAVAQNLHSAYALHLLNALGETGAAQQSLIEPLSERELEILRRVGAGYSNQEIAQDLVLAISTVKKHVNNIYGKLAVGSRTQAVARARELGLL